MYLQILKILYNNFQESSCEIVRRMNTEQEIVSRLKFIGKVKKGEKINTHHMCVQPEGLITNLKRTFWIHDNRNHAFLDSGTNIFLGSKFEEDAPEALDKMISFLDTVFAVN